MKVLVTDKLFIFDQHRALLQANFELKPLLMDSSEAALCKALADVDGYILGGMEKVTTAVLDAAPKLKAIAFTGTGYKEAIPAYEEATRRKIKISNAPGANADAVARFTIGQILSVTRRWPEVWAPMKPFERYGVLHEYGTVFDAEEMTVAVIGFGPIGQKVAAHLKMLGFNVILGSDRPLDQTNGFEAMSVADAVKRADVVTLHVSKGRGDGVLNASMIASWDLRSSALTLLPLRSRTM